MPHPTGPTNENTRKLIAELRKKKEKFYSDLARHLEKSKRNKAQVNVQRIQKLSNKFTGFDFVVPGKVLGVGELNKAINVYALSFSRDAKAKITKAGGKAHTLSQLMKDERADIKVRMVI